ncbi:hypothetical protein NQ318_004488 [Aromia moschata]|uniref:Uncharacterized protein n=1 Tax=Aromia moschata TaxID=1265417 RepID=A0AAV8XA28_9CUCU|nr:hypothetical protein NQ318_004488 [Aromia moschata]
MIFLQKNRLGETVHLNCFIVWFQMQSGSYLPARCALALFFLQIAAFTMLVPTCPPECICLSQTQVLCNSGGLQQIPKKLLPPTVEHLSLTRNHFPIIKSDSFAGLRYLRKLSLDGNNISIIKPFAFRGLPRLRELSIQQTPLATVAQFAFAGLQNITSIYLSHNKIRKVEGYAFAGTSNLRLLVLTNNPIHKIDSHAFSGLTNVERLSFPSVILYEVCKLSNETVNIAPDLATLRRRDLEGRGIEESDSEEELLNSNNNKDSDEESPNFPPPWLDEALPSILQIRRWSGVRQLEPDAFNGLDTVGYIKLAFMDLPGLQPGIFRGLTNVGVLSIQESDLGIIDGAAFDEMSFIKSLNILNNKIDAIEYLNITQEQRIGHVKFQGNHILEIPKAETLTIEVEKLTVISNHFPCNCHIHSLLEGPLANGSILDFISKNFCISPLEVNGMPMTNIDVESIGRCEEEVTRGNLEASKESVNDSNKISVLFLKCVCLIAVTIFTR